MRVLYARATRRERKDKEIPISYGTGFFVSEDGYFLTARQVLLKKTSTGEMVLQDLKEVSLEKPEGHLVKNVELTLLDNLNPL